MLRKKWFLFFAGTTLLTFATAGILRAICPSYPVEYQRPAPLMDYVQQNIGVYDTNYSSVLADDCRDCHGDRQAGANRHQFTASAFADCPDGSPLAPPDCLSACHPDPNTPQTITSDCLDCHDPTKPPLPPLDQVPLPVPHHATDLSGSDQCTVCHRPDLLVETKSVQSSAYYPPANIPTPYTCENCHWSSAPTDWPKDIRDNRRTHHFQQVGNVYPECYKCHALDDPVDPAPEVNPYDPEYIRYCENCHSKDTLHAIHDRAYYGWEAVGFHTPSEVPGDPCADVEPSVYREFAADEICAGCHGEKPATEPVSAPKAPATTDLTPSHGPTDTSCLITGENFGSLGDVLMAAKMGDTGQTHRISSGNCTWEDDFIVFTVPSSLDPGNYDVRVETPNGVSNMWVFTLTGPPVSIPCPTQAAVINSIGPSVGVPSVLVTMHGQDFGDRHTTARSVQLKEKPDGLQWVEVPIYRWTDSLINWKLPVFFNPGDHDVRVVTESGNSNQVVVRIEDHPTVLDGSPDWGLCGTLSTLVGNGGFQDQQSKMYSDGYHGVHHVVDFVGSTGTYTAINYSNWGDISLEVSLGDTFEDQIDPTTGQRNFVQDDGSSSCPNEPTNSCGGLPLDTYAVYVKAIYFEDEDSSGGLSCADMIIRVASSDPFYFELIDQPYIDKRRPRQVERKKRLRLFGDNFGPYQMSGEVRIGTRKAYNTDPLGGGKLQNVMSWSNTLIKVKVKAPQKWEGKTRFVWVVKNGLVSNKKRITILTPSP